MKKLRTLFLTLAASSFSPAITVAAPSPEWWPASPWQSYVYDADSLSIAWASGGFEGNFKIPFRTRSDTPGWATGRLTFEISPHFQSSDPLFSKDAEGTPRITLSTGSILKELGVIDIGGDGNDEIYFRDSSWGSSCGNDRLHLLIPASEKIVSLNFSGCGDWTNISEETTSANFAEPALEKFSQFLRAAAQSNALFNEVDAKRRPDDARFAVYFWRKHETAIASGQMRPRRYPGHSIVGKLATEPNISLNRIQYSLYFKGPVVAYDTKRDESWIVYMPDDSIYSSIRYDDLKIFGKHLMILSKDTDRKSTLIAIVDLNSNAIWDYSKNTDTLDMAPVKSLQAGETYFLIDGHIRLPYPKSSNAEVSMPESRNQKSLPTLVYL